MNSQYHNTKKSFHLIHEDGVRRLRTTFDPAVHTKFNPDVMFHPIWESSNFFDLFLPEGVTYGEISTFGNGDTLENALSEFDRVGRRGFYSSALPVKETHRVIYGDWDDHGISVVVPVHSGVSKLEDLGVQLTMSNKNDKPKVRKYFRRIRAHHEWAVAGEVKSSYAVPTGSVLRVECPGVGEEPPLHFDVLHIDLNTLDERNKAMADGVHLIDVDMLRELGKLYGIAKLEKIQVGDAFKGTMFSKLGLGKGFFHVVKMDRFGVIIYGPKKQVKFDKFFLGSLGDVKGGDAYTCIQSLGAFITEESHQLWIDQAILFINEVMESIHNEEKLRHLFLVNVAPVAELVENDTESWVLVEALRHGVPILRNPGLFRRVVRHLMTKVLDCERARIPYGPVARRFNLMPDLTCFDFETGAVDYRKSVIPENAVVCMDSDMGPFAMYRQPLGNAKEAVVTTNVHNRRFRRFVGRDRVILGVSAMEQLQQMGGGDFDDAVIGTSNVSWVEVIFNSEYPITPLPPAEEAIVSDLDQDNLYLDGGTIVANGKTIKRQGVRRQFPCNWSMVDYFDAITRATETQITIGPVDNGGRLDLLLSGEHKENELRSIAARIEKCTDVDEKAKLQRAYTWLENREDHQLRQVMSNLESFIDFIKMGKGDQSVLQEMVGKISDVSQNSLVYPECWTWLGRTGRGRVPATRLEAQDYILAPSLVCETLNTIRVERDKLMEALREEEWLMVQPIPAGLDVTFPRDSAIREEAFSLRSAWREAWDPFLTNQTLTDPDRAYKIILNGGTVKLRGGETIEVEGIRTQFNQWKSPDPKDPDQDLRPMLATEIARQTYRTRHSEAQRNMDGRRRSFSDGLLWTNCVGLMYIQALKEAGLTGLYMPVKFDRYSTSLGRGTIEVKLLGGIVTRKSDNFLIGYTLGEETPEDGDYVMKDGMICVQEPDAELRESADEFDEVFDNPVTDDELVVEA